jgi:hypothetical protein
MGREEPGDSHPIINEWGGAWVVPNQVRMVWPIPGQPMYKFRTFPTSLPQIQPCDSGELTCPLLHWLIGEFGLLHFCFCFFRYWGLNSGPSPWATFCVCVCVCVCVCDGYYEIRSCKLLYAWAGFKLWPSWSLPPEVTRITGVNHQCLARWPFLIRTLGEYL